MWTVPQAEPGVAAQVPTVLLRPHQDASFGTASAKAQLGRGQHHARACARLRFEAQSVAHARAGTRGAGDAQDRVIQPWRCQANPRFSASTPGAGDTRSETAEICVGARH